MKTILRTLLIVLGLGVLLSLASGCLVEEKVIELVLTGESSAEFVVDDTDAAFEETAVVELGDKIADILDSANLGRDEVGSAHLSGVDFEVLTLDGTHDWQISGAIDVERDASGNFVQLLAYTSQSVEAALGVRQAAPLTAAGVSLINQALADFLAGASPARPAAAPAPRRVGPRRGAPRGPRPGRPARRGRQSRRSGRAGQRRLAA